MMVKTLVSVALALTLGALSAPPAGAAHRSRERHDEKLAVLALRIEKASHQLYCDASESLRRGSWARWRALWALRGLDHQAQAFRRAVQRGSGEHHMRQEFRELEWSLRIASRRLDHLRRSRELRRDVERVDRLMERVDRRLAFASEHPSRHARHAHSARLDSYAR
jgi:hypothetical protein